MGGILPHIGPQKRRHIGYLLPLLGVISPGAHSRQGKFRAVVTIACAKRGTAVNNHSRLASSNVEAHQSRGRSINRKRKKPLKRGFFTMHIERGYALGGLLVGVQRLVIIHQDLCHFRTGEFRRGRNALAQHLAHLGP